MAKKAVYLTIDDSPSRNFNQKIDFLKSNNIPATFFCVGQKIVENMDLMVRAVREGFLIGNHSYSHPRFSNLNLHEIRSEILKTEKLIDQVYLISGCERHQVLFRFPYGDVGYDCFNNNKRLPWVLQIFIRRYKLRMVQRFLRMNGFAQPIFSRRLTPLYHDIGYESARDVYWTFDTLDHKFTNSFDFRNHLESGVVELRNEFGTGASRALLKDNDADIVLMHDHDDNLHILKEFLSFIQDNNIEVVSL